MSEATLEGRLTAVVNNTVKLIDQLESNLELLHSIAKPLRLQRSFAGEAQPQPPRYIRAIYRRIDGEKSFVTA